MKIFWMTECATTDRYVFMYKHCGLLNTALCLKRSLCGAFKLLVSALTVIGPYLIKSLELKIVRLPLRRLRQSYVTWGSVTLFFKIAMPCFCPQTSSLKSNPAPLTSRSWAMSALPAGLFGKTERVLKSITRH